MADCIVILECCTGQTGCNEKITIGYLKSFIMSGSTHLIKTTAGTDVNVNSSKPDSYEPTYAELTSGSILPIYSDGGNNRGASSVDGITIGGSYTANETVDQTDLTLTYTRFKSLSISAGKTTFDKCGDSTTMSYTYTLTKTVKGISVCDPLTYSYTSTDVRDTSNTAPNKVTFSAGCNWINVSGTGISAGQNGTGHSSTRTCNISASVMYKGNTQTAGNTVTIRQAGVGGSWIYSSTTYDSLSIYTYDDTEYDCFGGSFSISGTGYYTEYYYWRDDCGNNYYNETTTSSDSEYAGKDSGSFPTCPDAHNQTDTLSVTWHGITKSMTFRQICTCEDCTNYNDYGSCSDDTESVDECGGNVTVYCQMPITTHTRTWVDGVCVDTTGTTSQRQSATVFVPENATQSPTSHTGSVTTEEGGTIYYTINQSSGPCGGCTGDVTTYQYANVTTSITACETNVPVSIPYTATTTYDNCSTTISYGTATTSYTVSKNETSSSTSYTKTYVGIGSAEATITINQGAGPCTCLCSMLTVTPTSYTWTYDKTSSDTKDITISKADCNSGITINTLSHFNATLGTNKITVSPKGTNTSGSDYQETLIISYKADSTNCSSSVTLTQTAQDDPCIGKTCSELTVTGVTTAFNTSSHNNVTIGNFSKGACATITNVTSSDNWLSNVSADTSTNTIKGTMGAQGCETSSRTSTVTLYWTVNGNSCHSAWTVTQNGDSSTCPCTNYEYSATTDAPSGEPLYVDKCGGDVTLHFSVKRKCTSPAGSWEDCTAYYSIGYYSTSNFSQTSGATYITFTKNTPNEGNDNIRSGYYIAFFKEASKTNEFDRVSFNVEQPSGCTTDPCAGKQCSEFALSNKKSSCFSKASHTNEQIATYTNSSCVNTITVSSNGGWLTPTIDSANKKILASMDARECNTSQRSARVTVSWVVNGNSCSDYIDVCQDGDSTPCSNPCSCSNFSASTTALTFNSSGTLTSSFSWKKNPTCDDTFTLSGDSNVIGTPTLNSDGSITVSVNSNTSTTSTYSGALKVMLGSSSCTTLSYSVAARSCTCEDLNTPETVTVTVPSGGSSNFVVWKVLKNSCTSAITATSGSCNSLFTSVGTGTSGSYYVVSATVGTNTSESSKTCNIGYRLYRTGSSVACDSGSTTVTVEGQGCNCTTANAALGSYSVSTLPYSGGSSYYIPYTADCGTVTATTDENWMSITSINTSLKRIYFSVTANNSTSSRTNGIKLYINNGSSYCDYEQITQAGISCDCTGGGLYMNGVGTNVPASGGSNILVGTYTAKSACESSVNIWSTHTGVTSVTLSNGNIYADILPTMKGTGVSVGLEFRGNFTTSADTYCDHFTQTQNSCTCDDPGYEISTTALTFSNAGGTQYIYFTGHCGTIGAGITTGTSFITTSITGNRVSVTVSSNSSSSSRSGEVQLYLTTENQYGSTVSSCYQKVTISQSASDCNCSNSNISVTAVGSAFAYSGGSSVKVATYTASCTEGLSFSSPDGLTNFSFSNGNVYANIPANTSFNSTYYTIKWSFGGTECSGSATIGQSGKPCDCETNNFKFTENNSKTLTENVGSGSSSVTVSYSVDCNCAIVSSTTSGDSSLISSVSINNTSKTVTVSFSQNPGASTRTAGVKLTVNGLDCGAIWLTIVQAAGTAPCQCSNFAITDASFSSTCVSNRADTTGTIIAHYSGACGSITSITSNQSWIYGLAYNPYASPVGSGSIEAKFSGNCSSEREATITVAYTANGSSCTSKTFKVKQCKGGYSGISSSTQVDCNGGTVTFTVTSN